MTGMLFIKVFDRQDKSKPVFEGEFDGPVELGRQRNSEEPLFQRRPDGLGYRVAIARLLDDTISREHIYLEPMGDARVRLTNRSKKLPIQYTKSRRELSGQGESCELTLPTEMSLGHGTLIKVESPDMQSVELQSLNIMTTPPGLKVDLSTRLGSIAAPGKSNAEMENFVRWLQATMDVLQSAANSSEFFGKAANAMVEHIGLNSGRVLLVKGGEWHTECAAGDGSRGVEHSWRPSGKVLRSIMSEKRTFWQVPNQGPNEYTDSLVGVKAVVAAPILNRQGEVIGALYGDRRQDMKDLRNANTPPITKIHALLVELLASGVAAGLARVEQEKKALEARVQFEQFFTPELAQQLAAHPDMLSGRNCEVTILFCDIRRFSRIAEKLEPDVTMRWMGDVLEALSACVLEERGVVVDYIGDEMMAMWGAPENQPEHAEMACRSAMRMLECLPKLNEQWQTILGQPLALGIGINTGPARVGNSGTLRKFKYGPMGNTVNMASRVQGATKYLKSTCLITGSTQAKLGSGFYARRLGKVGVVNIAKPEELYELVPSEQQDWSRLQGEYESALLEFEKKNFRATVRILGNLLSTAPSDSPALLLLSRALNCLLEDLPDDWQPVLRLPGK